MPKLALSVRIAAASLLVLSVLHVLFWAVLAVASRTEYTDVYPYTLFFPVACAFSAAGLGGVFVGVGLLRTRAWARIAALVLAALVGVFSALGLLALVLVTLRIAPIEFAAETPPGYFMVMGIVYCAVFILALWWIYLFSRRSVAAQFAEARSPASPVAPEKAACPPPVALLAWLMIISSLLSAVSWPLILGKIPAMLFVYIFSPIASKWIWIANIVLFLTCGVGLLRLQRWSYSSTIALHAFWLVSLFVSQLSPLYPQYLARCFVALQTDQTATYFVHFHFPLWASALTTAIPTALLVVGLFYYRRSFLQAVDDSRHQSS